VLDPTPALYYSRPFKHSESKNTQILLPLTTCEIFSSLQSHGPKIPQDDSLQVPLLKDKKRAGSKAPAVVLCEHSPSMFISFSFS